MSEAMRGATKAMMAMNSAVKMPQMQKIMMEFEKQSDIMEQKQEMMEDTMDSVMDEGDEEEQSEEIVEQIMSELNIDLKAVGMGRGGALPAASAPAADDDLAARLEKLKNPNA